MVALRVRLDARRGHPLASPTAATSCCCCSAAARPSSKADSEHPFGYGRERYVYAFLVSIILFSVGGLFSIYEGVEKIIHPHELENLWIPLTVLLVAIVLESFSLRTAVKESNHIRAKDESWVSFVRHAKAPELPVVLLEDVAALIGLVFALLGVGLTAITRNPLFDAIGTLMIGTLLIVIAIMLGIETKSLLVGEGANRRRPRQDRRRDRPAAPRSSSSSTSRRSTWVRTSCWSPRSWASPADRPLGGRRARHRHPREQDPRGGADRTGDLPRARHLPRRMRPGPAHRGVRDPVAGLSDARPMQYCIFTEPQLGASYDDQLAFAQAAERLGFDGFFRSDHYLRGRTATRSPGRPTPGRRSPASHVRPRASGSARWSPRSRSAIPGSSRSRSRRWTRCRADASSWGSAPAGSSASTSPTASRSPRKRFDLLEEQLEIITGLWSTPVGETYSFSGAHYALTDAPALPKPVQTRVPVIVGGNGPRRTPELAARFATEFNLGFPSRRRDPGAHRTRARRLRAHRARPVLPVAVARDVDVRGRR